MILKLHVCLLSLPLMVVNATSTGSSALLEEVRRTSVKAGPMLPLTKEKFQLMTFAQELSVAVSKNSWDMHDGGPEGLYGDAATYYEDALDVDAILTLDASDYCFVAWRGELKVAFGIRSKPAPANSLMVLHLSRDRY